MARFVFVVPPLNGHINPTISLGRTLMRRGHRVAWIGFPDLLVRLLPPEAELLPVFNSIPKEIVETAFAKFHGHRGAAALKVLWEDFLLPLTRAMVPGVEAAIDLFQPDVMVVDQQTYAGTLVAQRRGLVWATSATTSAEVADPFAGLPRIRSWVEANHRALQHEFEVPTKVMERSNLRCSPYLALIFSSAELVGERAAEFPPHYAFVGPSIEARPETAPFDWKRLDARRRRIFVSLGTVNADMGRRFFNVVVEAFAPSDLQVILVAPPEVVGPVPDNFIVQERVPQLALLPHVHAVISHGGHNTVCESLAEGLPLVMSPIRDDQPIVAEQVVRVGAGLRVPFGRVRAPELRTAVETVLTEPSYRAAARRIRASFHASGGPLRAAELLEKIA